MVKISQTTRHKGKERAKPITPLSETASEEDSDPEQAQRDKDMQKNLALIAKTSSNSRNKNVDQRTVNVIGARENLGNTDEEVDEHELEAHYSYMAKIQEVPTADLGNDFEPVEQVLNDAGYNVFANDLQHSEQFESVSNTCLVETNDSNFIPDSPDLCEDAIQNNQNDIESDDERIALANLIANLKLDKTKVITDLKLRKEHDIDKMLSMEKQLKFLNEIVYKRSQSIQTIHMMAPKTHNDSFKFVHEVKQEMHADLKYVESLEKEIDELDSDNAEFSDMYDVILQECVKERDCLAQKLSNQTKYVSKEVYNELLKCFAKVEKHSISLEIALQKRKEQVKNDTVWNEKDSNAFQKEREQYIKIQDLKAQLQDKNIAISELKKHIEKGKGKSVDTKFDKPSVVRQPNAKRIPKPSVLGKPTHFTNSLERMYFPKTKSVSKTNVSEGLSKPVTAQALPQTARQAE
nr:hypothetical protein [Tanacetum cinerariifolium]